MNLYHGKNDSHEFWEDETGGYLIIRHHGHDAWFAMNVAGKPCDNRLGTAKRPRTIVNRIRRQRGIDLYLDSSLQWVSKRKNERRMKLEPARSN